MKQTTTFNSVIPEEQVDLEVASFREHFEGKGALDQVVRLGTQQMLKQAIEAEVQEFLHEHDGRRDTSGNRLVVRNGHQPARKIVTGAGALEVQAPRVRDNSPVITISRFYIRKPKNGRKPSGFGVWPLTADRQPGGFTGLGGRVTEARKG